MSACRSLPLAPCASPGRLAYRSGDGAGSAQKDEKLHRALPRGRTEIPKGPIRSRPLATHECETAGRTCRGASTPSRTQRPVSKSCGHRFSNWMLPRLFSRSFASFEGGVPSCGGQRIQPAARPIFTRGDRRIFPMAVQ